MKRRFGKVMQMILSILAVVGAALAVPITARADVAYESYDDYVAELYGGIFVVCIVVALVVGFGVFLIVLGIRKSRENSSQEDTRVEENEET